MFEYKMQELIDNLLCLQYSTVCDELMKYFKSLKRV